MERQVEDQSQKFHLTEIDLATERQMVLDLKAKLQKSKDAAQVASEAVEAVVKASYERGVWDTETRLAKEVVIMCRDYCTKSWAVALDQAGVPADSELRRAENIFFPKNIREISNMVPPPTQPPTTQAPLLVLKFLKGLE